VTPPVGQNRSCGKGPDNAASMDRPPTTSAGNSFASVMPRSSSRTTSDGPAVPARNGTPVDVIASSSRSVAPGLTRNCAPAAEAASAWSVLTMVPTPSTMSGTSAAIARTPSSAARLRSVTSMIGSPPATSAFARRTARSGSVTTTTGMTGATSSGEQSSARPRPPAGAVAVDWVDVPVMRDPHCDGEP